MMDPASLSTRQAENWRQGNGCTHRPDDELYLHDLHSRHARAGLAGASPTPPSRGAYWRHQRAGEKTFRSDWKKGSTYDLAHQEAGLVVSDPEQVILESDPCRQLAYTWHTFTPEWAAQVAWTKPPLTPGGPSPAPEVAFDIEDTGHGV